MVEAEDSEITLCRKVDIALKTDLINSIAPGAKNWSAAWVVTDWLILIPEALHGRVDAYAARVEGFEIVVCTAESGDAISQVCGGNCPLKRLRVWKAVALVVPEEISLAAQKSRENRAASCGAKPVVVVAWLGRPRVVIVPCVRVKVIVEVIFVNGTVQVVRSALRDHFDLGTR